MSTDEELLRDFLFEPGLDWWEAERHVPCWGGSLPVRIAAPAAGPSARQIAVLRALLSHPGNVRGEVKRAVFDHYKAEVEGTWGYTEKGVDVTDLRAPRLQAPAEIWKLLRTFSVFIPALREGRTEIVFEIHLECSWDADHGLCVLFRDWRAAEVAGQTDCQGGEY
jgi:hypothetical protein